VKEKEIAGGDDGSARVAGNSGLYSGVTDQATSTTFVTRSCEHLICHLVF
jgi:hypothetical protein